MDGKRYRVVENFQAIFHSPLEVKTLMGKKVIVWGTSPETRPEIVFEVF